MRPMTLRSIGAATFLGTLVTASSVLAQGPAKVPANQMVATPLPASPSPVAPPSDLTAKERLSEKWTDEQRVDNCKVPPDKRGPRPRPDACPEVPTN